MRYSNRTFTWSQNTPIEQSVILFRDNYSQENCVLPAEDLSNSKRIFETFHT